MPRILNAALRSLLVAALANLALASRAADYIPLVSGSIAEGAGEAGRGAAWAVFVCQQDNRRPIALFGAVKKAGEKSEYLYLILFKTPKEYDGAGFDFSGRGKGSFIAGSGEIATNLGGKRFDILYDLVLDAASHELSSGTIRINDQELKLETTRMYIADMTGEAIKYIPVEIDLPGAPDVSDAKNLMNWSRHVAKTIEELKERPETIMLLRD